MCGRARSGHSQLRLIDKRYVCDGVNNCLDSAHGYDEDTCGIAARYLHIETGNPLVFSRQTCNGCVRDVTNVVLLQVLCCTCTRARSLPRATTARVMTSRIRAQTASRFSAFTSMTYAITWSTARAAWTKPTAVSYTALCLHVISYQHFVAH